jgi:hypothetical protein
MDHHYITEIVLKVSLNIITLTLNKSSNLMDNPETQTTVCTRHSQYKQTKRHSQYKQTKRHSQYKQTKRHSQYKQTKRHT